MEWVAFTPDGRRLVGVTGTNGRVMVWSMPDGTLISDTQVNDSGIYGGDISPDGRFLVTGGDGSGGVKLFDLATDTPIGPSFGGPTSTIQSVDISPNGTTLLAAGDQVYLWDVASRRALGVPFPGGKPTYVSSFSPATYVASFSPDGSRAYILSRSGEGWVWDVDPASWQTRACEVAGRTLTPQEWSSLLPERPYEPACA
jgi:WD40 repeat protein